MRTSWKPAAHSNNGNRLRRGRMVSVMVLGIVIVQRCPGRSGGLAVTGGGSGRHNDKL